MKKLTPLLALLALCACAGEEAGDADVPAPVERESGTLPTDTAPGVATAAGNGDAGLAPADLERGRHDASWRPYAERSVDTTRPSGARAGDQPAAARPGDPPSDAASPSRGTSPQAPDTAESWDDIAPDAVNAGAVSLPLHGEVEGPSVLAVQILLDRSLYRPGVIDGRWGKNTEKAVFWMQEAEGLDPTGRVEDATLARLREAAGDPGALVVERTLTEADVAGPFVRIPESVYDRADLECLCYESLREQLGERFHATPELLEQLNPGVDLNALSAGDALHVPDVGPFEIETSAGGAATASPRAGAGEVAEIVVSDGGHWVHALDADGALLYHFPSTLGSQYAPSPAGDYSIDSVHQDPTWHYKPDLLTGVDPSKPDAVLPPGPNNAVGVVWMQLSKDHYGIHGTSAPSTIGYATSHGCIRLTNWDAEFLSHRVEGGTPVRFIDATGRARAGGNDGTGG